MNLRIERMTIADLGEVLEIERDSYTAPWSARAYEYELRYNDMAHYMVARTVAAEESEQDARGWRAWLKRLDGKTEPPAEARVIGYVGYWMMAGEAHISTLAVHPSTRRRSIGELLLANMLEDAHRRAGHVATLEVRISNRAAQELYIKYGFEKVGLRKAYYSDNNEDAYIMTTPPLASPVYQQKLQRLRTALDMRLTEQRQRSREDGRWLRTNYVRR